MGSEATELGLKFKPKVAGYILGVRFYKGPKNTGTHTASLWTKNGNKLATVKFENETSSGWQQANFAQPVAVAANTVYVVSYYAPAGSYSEDKSYFTSSGVDSGPLRALMDGEAGANGVFKYNKSGFPFRNGRGSNYWIDVVFNTAPTLTSTNVSLASEESEVSQLAAPSVRESVSRQAPDASREPSLSCSPAIVRAGESFRCAVALRGPAGGEERRFSIDTPSSDVLLPSRIRMRPGQSTAFFVGTILDSASDPVLKISASDGEFRSETAISVLAAGTPSLEAPETTIMRPGDTARFTVAAADPLGLPVRSGASKLPEGAAFNPESGSFEWTPAAGQEGRHELAFEAVNSANQSSSKSVFATVAQPLPVLDSSSLAACSPRAIATLRGTWLTAEKTAAADPRGRATQLGGAIVKVNGSPVQLLAASPDRIDFICPDLAPGEQLSIDVETRHGRSAAVTAIQQEASPAILPAYGQEESQGRIRLSESSLLAAPRDYRETGDPALPGDLVEISATGLGNLAQSGKLSVSIGGRQAEVESIAHSETEPATLSIRVRVPADAMVGDAVPVEISVTGSNDRVFRSNIVTMAIEARND
ncbi:MAG: DUF4082 domain-containing protein [Bryobacteraceae bacterium]|nr:DUF4082 domain-containing protein [Bryobacteraceae bacterium]